TIAQATLPVLITGETGAGKEVLARAVHHLSGRTGPFVAFNCGALPETLVEAELFGHRKGAFSDAKEDRPGLVRAAHGGTLFLDEMGELKSPAQAALLRVLEESEVRPIGATAPIKVDVQFVSATNRSLEKMVAAGSFRADLYHRLAGHVLPLVPLRERREDMGLIVGSLLRRHAGTNPANVRLNSSAWRKLLEYGFPGNARELDKALHAAVALSRGGEIGAEHLPNWVREEPTEAPASERGENEPLRDDLIRHFREQKGNVSAVARVMGKARVQVQRWMKRFKIDPQQYSK
ncbi:MAG TPA: sigma 54-interacting transcriptional regulator, partial [Polyangium sp.]|nr:sigma 54-interacting transcriptional regulator [Polyangium sp.]